MHKISLMPMLSVGATAVFISSALASQDTEQSVADDVISAQRAALAASTEGVGFGPQSPRDIDSTSGENDRAFARAPAHTDMNLCNIHFHKNAEHRGGEFTKFAGNGDGKGAGTGYKYDGTLTSTDLAPLDSPIGSGAYGDLKPGDTIEVHFVHTTAQVDPGPTLGSCLSEAIGNPQLRVETQVVVLVNNDTALDFVEMTKVQRVEGYHQAPNIPNDMGTPIQYAGSTTGPSFNEAGSPFQVTWSVRPEVARVNIHSVGTWLAGNIFDEADAHGVRNLVVNPDLLSQIGH
ncbi:MAG: delta-class carbonic anhydrase [Paracoccaceae bacterium]|nr:delta-class carbonic anhydrase [Paracoccaceae bacterium]